MGMGLLSGRVLYSLLSDNLISGVSVDIFLLNVLLKGSLLFVHLSIFGCVWDFVYEILFLETI